MSFCLEAMTSCFQGIIPAMLFTCSKDGVPNAAFLSHVDYVDATHVALSFQFFNKSRRNIAENPNALVHLLDPDTSEGWGLRLRFVRSETSGPLFDRMHLRIEAIASYSGLKGIFKLLAADVYEVLTVERLPEEGGRAETAAKKSDRPAFDAVFTMKALQDLSTRINSAATLESLLDSILEGLEALFGFNHSMILLTGEQPGTLVTLATRGYPEGGVGAEAHLGEGIIGMVAEAQKPIRISGLLRGMLHAHAVYERAHAEGIDSADAGIRLPGLKNPESQLGVPLLVRGELVGVLCIESEEPYRFHEEDKTSIELLGSYLAIAIQNLQLHGDGRRSVWGWAGHLGGRAAAVARGYRFAATRARVLPERRVHSDRRRVPDPEPPRAHPVEAAVGAAGGRACRVHQSRAAARQVAQPTRLQGQPRDASPPAAAAAGREDPRHPPGAAFARPLRARAHQRCAVDRKGLIGDLAI